MFDWEYDEEEPDCGCPPDPGLEELGLESLCPDHYLEITGKEKVEKEQTLVVIDLVGPDNSDEVEDIFKETVK